MDSLFRRVRSGCRSIHPASGGDALARRARLVRTYGNISRALGRRGRALLLRARTALENRSVVRSFVERSAGCSLAHRRHVEADRGAADPAGAAGPREARLRRFVLPDLSAAGTLHVAAYRARTIMACSGRGAAFVCMFERPPASHAKPFDPGQRGIAPRSLARRPDEFVEPEGYS